MPGANVLQCVLFLVLVTALVPPADAYMLRVFDGRHTWLDPALRPVERGIYRLTGVDPNDQMDWRTYAACFVGFILVGTALLFAVLLVQSVLPFYDATNLSTPMTPDLAANVAVSFATTTTWQPYAGESTMSYTTQMVGLAAQNFLAGAAGLAIGIAFIRGLAGRRAQTLGNFWVDLVRAILWVLLPISLVGGLLLVWQGVPLNWQPYTQATTLEGASQTIAQGPVAAIELIKNLGTNGGGFFNANGAHPYENPTPLTNTLEGKSVRVVVADRGPGIPMDALPNLFEPFYRVMDGQARPQGLGLGLAIVKGLVEAHGGRVKAENRGGGGAQFTVTLPLGGATADGAPTLAMSRA